MSNGYSIEFVRRIQKAPTSLGVRLGRLCVKKEVSVIEVAKHFKVSKVTVYNWFVGKHAPKPAYEGKIREYIKKSK